ncbi:hypothetical protein [Neolewinella antarctica]|uniref:Uncharacterized protein n=1 Tax=Neolewinella antarctica TaxID=442734 RepID=A0ABX0XFN1_9BACT|nr:hypothetical protein [Neolewinella antarctica]NJC27689.1 hypothetical protein [Neolewinella antarctica]
MFNILLIASFSWSIGIIVFVRYPYFTENDRCTLQMVDISYPPATGGYYAPVLISEPFSDGCREQVYLSNLIGTKDYAALQQAVLDVEKSGYVFSGYCSKVCYFEKSDRVLSLSEIKNINIKTMATELLLAMTLLIWPAVQLLRGKKLFWWGVCIVISATPNALTAQTPKLGINFPTYAVQTKIDTVYTYIYDTTSLIRRTNLDTNDISLQYPEQVLEAMVNSTGNDWVDFYAEPNGVERKYKKERHYVTLNKSASEDFYFRPVLKLVYLYEGEVTTFIRYRIVDQRVPFNIAALCAIKKVGDKYLLKTKPTRADITFALTYLKKDVLMGLLDPNRDDLNKLKEKVFTDEKLDLSLLGQYFMYWYQNTEFFDYEIKNYVEKI